MSDTASRFQMRFGYQPGLRVGQYPAPPPVQAAAPVAGGVAPPVAFRSAATPAMAPSVGPEAGPAVMAGSIDPERLRNGQDGAGGSAQGDYGGPGPSGIGSTGSALSDIAGFASEAGRAAGGIAGGPMGVAGLGFGAMASGLAAAFGAPQTAAGIASAFGLPGVAPSPYSYSAAEGDFGGPKGTETAYGMSSTPPGTPALGPSDMSALGPAPDKASLGYGAAETGGGNGDPTGGMDPGGHESGHADGLGFQQGGYTGHGGDGVVQASNPAGTVHEGEVVIPAHQVQRYGLDPLLMLARGQVQPSRLSALLTR